VASGVMDGIDDDAWPFMIDLDRQNSHWGICVVANGFRKP